MLVNLLSCRLGTTSVPQPANSVLPRLCISYISIFYIRYIFLDCIFNIFLYFYILYSMYIPIYLGIFIIFGSPCVCVRGNKLVLQEGEGRAFCGNNLGNRWSCLFARKQEVSRRQDRAIARKIIVGHHLSLCLCHKYTSLEQQ